MREDGVAAAEAVGTEAAFAIFWRPRHVSGRSQQWTGIIREQQGRFSGHCWPVPHFVPPCAETQAERRETAATVDSNHRAMLVSWKCELGFEYAGVGFGGSTGRFASER